MFYVLTSCITEACELSLWFLDWFSKIHQASVFSVLSLSWGIHGLVMVTQAESFSRNETVWASAGVQLVGLKLRFLHLVFYFK